MSARGGWAPSGIGRALALVFAGIYGRKSTDQAGVSEEQRSVTRQIERAREYAARHGWVVREECIWVDDGISGAEFVKRPGFLRLMNALKPRPPFQVLIMSEESRLGREAIETSYALKQILDAGVRVFYYLEDRERTLDSATDKVLLAVTSFAGELERERAQQRTHDALLRLARAGRVTGGRLYGYDNVEVTAPGPDGRPKRQYVTRDPNPEQAAVVHRLFELCAAGWGFTRLAKQLNASAKQYGLMGKEVDPRKALAVLLTVTVYAEDRDWRQGRADELCRALPRSSASTSAAISCSRREQSSHGARSSTLR